MKQESSDKPTEPQAALPPIKRTSEGLRDGLFDEIDRVRNGLTTTSNANAIARLAGEINKTTELEFRIFNWSKSNQKLPETLRLGSA